MRLRSVAALLAFVAAAAAASCTRAGGLIAPAYEYEEDVTLSLDGSATLIVNASVPALVALRGLPLDPDLHARGELLKSKIRELYSSPYSQVLRVATWTRYGRRFVGVRLRVPDIRALSKAAPFSWSTYELRAEANQVVYTQTVAGTGIAASSVAGSGWKGNEIVAFRLHLPARIRWHNSRDPFSSAPRNPSRGNILTWEQTLADRLANKPIAWSEDHRPGVIEVRMDPQSILYRTLWLFGLAFLAAIAVIAGLIWLAIRRAPPDPAPSSPLR
jgi:hypothetical protein